MDPDEIFVKALIWSVVILMVAMVGYLFAYAVMPYQVQSDTCVSAPVLDKQGEMLVIDTGANGVQIIPASLTARYRVQIGDHVRACVAIQKITHIAKWVLPDLED